MKGFLLGFAGILLACLSGTGLVFIGLNLPKWGDRLARRGPLVRLLGLKEE